MKKEQKAGADNGNGKITLYNREGKQQDIYFETGNDGLEFYRFGGNDNRITINVHAEDLEDGLRSILYPIDNLIEHELGNADDPEPIFFLLQGIVEQAEDRIAEICRAIEKKVGEIELHSHNSGADFFGLKRDEILMVTVKPSEKAA